VVYAVTVETGLNREELGKLILAACFVTDLGTVLALSLSAFVPTLIAQQFFAPEVRGPVERLAGELRDEEDALGAEDLSPVRRVWRVMGAERLPDRPTNEEKR
jgi:hypothetical protein